jgi:LmbE family N-acetylglucosaminyl deacetylase
MTDVHQVKSVLAVGAHPDDIEILCGGTLAKYAQMGVKVSMAVSADGAAGHMVIPPKELAEIRHAEAKAAAAVIGADFYWLGFPDGTLYDNLENRMAYVELIRKAKPDVIITHYPNDYHPDHVAVSKLLFGASFISGLKNIKTESPFHPEVQPLVYMDSVNGANFLPTEYVDITETWAIKRKMLESFESQITWLRDHDHVDFFQMVEVQARSRGFQCGVEFAEAFGSENVWPRACPRRLLP